MSLWTTDTPLLKTLAQNASFVFGSSWVQPSLGFPGSGMTLSGVNGNYQFSGVQSKQSFTPPFAVQATVMGTVANGNPFELYLISGDLRQYLSIAGNINPRNFGYYGTWLSSGSTNLDILSGVNIYATPSVNVWYTISIAVDNKGRANVNVSDANGKLLGSRGGVNIGTGPLFVILAQREGLPNSGAGPNSAIWKQIEMTPLRDGNSPSNGLLLGAWLGNWPTASRISSFESDSGHHLDIVNIFMDWSQSVGDVAQSIQTVFNDNSLPTITWMPKGMCTQAIVDGTEDSYIRSFADSVASLGKPILIRPMHEMNGFWYSWSIGYVPSTWPFCWNSNESFTLAWKHIVQMFRQTGASNAQFVWCINNANLGPNTSFTGAYPGDDYVSYVGIDGYNWGNSLTYPTHSWQSFKQVFELAYQALTAARISKPVLIAEWASAEEGGSKPQWIANAFQTVYSGKFPRILGLIWFNEKKERDWRIESSASAQQAYCTSTRGSSRNTGASASTCNTISSSTTSTTTGSGPDPSVNRHVASGERLSISQILPSLGPAGTTVTVRGAGFNRVTSVTFGDTPATYTVISQATIRATVPDVSYADSTIKTLGPQSQVGVAVTITSASGSADSLFNYTGPR